MASETFVIERLPNNVLIVRMPSKPFHGKKMPDAVFTFRVGDPQYELWEKRYREQQTKKNSDEKSA